MNCYRVCTNQVPQLSPLTSLVDVTRLKWKHDPATDILTPARLRDMNARHVQGIAAGPSTLLTFDIVTNGVALLES